MVRFMHEMQTARHEMTIVRTQQLSARLRDHYLREKGLHTILQCKIKRQPSQEGWCFSVKVLSA